VKLNGPVSSLKMKKMKGHLRCTSLDEDNDHAFTEHTIVWNWSVFFFVFLPKAIIWELLNGACSVRGHLLCNCSGIYNLSICNNWPELRWMWGSKHCLIDQVLRARDPVTWCLLL